MDGVRARNESAWLLPNDGSRTNHRLRLDMRQFADSDEIDLVIVGCGAGGSVLAQRLARAGGLAGGGARRRAVLGPRYRLGQRRGRALAHAAQSVMEDILRAAGADEVITIQRYAHLVGGARMAADERHGVVDRYCRSFAVPNLYITDGSVLPTQGSANPALTIMAVAARAADQLISGSTSR